MYVVRGKSGYKFFSTEESTFGKEVNHESFEQAENVLNQVKDTLIFEEFEIVELSNFKEESL